MTRSLALLPVTQGAVWRTAAAIVGAVVCASAASCSGASSHAPAAQPVSPRLAITQAADETNQVKTLTGTMSIQVGPSVSVSGRIQMQAKPTLLLGGKLTASDDGISGPGSVVLTSTAVYIEPSGGTGQPGKPWIEILLSSLSQNLGTVLTQALQETQSSNPLTQTQLLAVSANVHKVGTGIVSGVRTTQYAGTISPAGAISTLSPSLSKQLAPQLKMVSGDISWNAWLDSRHIVRKLTENETVDSQPTTLTVTITSVNHPVTITVPPASEVTVQPASVLYAQG